MRDIDQAILIVENRVILALAVLSQYTPVSLSDIKMTTDSKLAFKVTQRRIESKANV